MISRVWHGYTTPENADVYENLLKDEIIVGIKDRLDLSDVNFFLERIEQRNLAC